MKPERDRLVRCPKCGSQNLIGSEGWITCGWIECKEPGLTSNLDAHKQDMQRLADALRATLCVIAVDQEFFEKCHRDGELHHEFRDRMLVEASAVLESAKKDGVIE